MGAEEREKRGVWEVIGLVMGGYHRGVAGGSLLGVWGDEGRFRWKIEGCEPEYGRQDQQKVI